MGLVKLAGFATIGQGLLAAGKNLMTSNVVRNAAIGAGVGAITGAANAESGQRLSGAFKGGILGGAVGGVSTAGKNIYSDMKNIPGTTFGSAVKREGSSLMDAGRRAMRKYNQATTPVV